MKLIVQTGIPGVGKTTVLTKAVESLDEKFKIVNYGSKMFEVAQKEKIVKDRDEMRKMPPETQKRIQRMAAKAISKEAVKTNVVVDTHCTIKTPSGYLPGLPIWVLEELKPTQIINIEANPEEIQGRRVSDETRARDADDIKEIDEHQMINRATSMAYAMVTGATMKIVFNHNDRLDEAVESLKKAI